MKSLLSGLTDTSEYTLLDLNSYPKGQFLYETHNSEDFPLFFLIYIVIR